MKGIVITSSDWQKAFEYTRKAVDACLWWESVAEEFAVLSQNGMTFSPGDLAIVLAIDIQLSMHNGLTIGQFLKREMNRQVEGYRIVWDKVKFTVPEE